MRGLGLEWIIPAKALAVQQSSVYSSHPRYDSRLMAAGKSMFELSKKLLGLEGSIVTLSMKRVTDNSSYSLTMVRKETIRKLGACSRGERSRRRISPFAPRAGTVLVRVRVHGPVPAAPEADCCAPHRTHSHALGASVLHCQEQGWEAWASGTVPA